jgi:hypothetical protein
LTLTASAAPPDRHHPQHDDAVAQWLVRWREALAHQIDITPYDALDAVVADYRGYANEREPILREGVTE